MNEMRLIDRTRAVVTCALAGLLPLAGCGSSSSSSSEKAPTTTATPAVTVDTSAVETGIKQELSVQGATVTKVSCPGNVKSEAGSTFECSVSWSNGAAGKVKVTQTAPNHYTYVPVDGSVQIPGVAVDHQLESQLAKQGVQNAMVNCPSNVIVKTNSPVTCAVSSATGAATASVTFTFSTAQGTVNSSSVKSTS